MFKSVLIIALVATTTIACKKKGCTDPLATNYNNEAKKDDGSCTLPTPLVYDIPSTYSFTDASGNSTVSFSGQTERLNQLTEMISLAKTGTSTLVVAQDLKNMFNNTNDPFSFQSTKQLKDKCFLADVQYIENMLDDLALTSQSNSQMATATQAGILTSGSTNHLFDSLGFDLSEKIKITTMGAVFMYQALNVYMGYGKMSADNTTPANGEYFTDMEHHWDEAFGYFGVPIDFPTTLTNQYWGNISNLQDSEINSNSQMMSNFLKGRAAISNGDTPIRDIAIEEIRQTWEHIAASQAIAYLNEALTYEGVDQALFLHTLTKAYSFVYCLRYSPTETRRFSNSEHSSLMNLFTPSLWQMTNVEISNISTLIYAKFQ